MRARIVPLDLLGLSIHDGSRMIARIADINALVAQGRLHPASAFAESERLAQGDQWQTREVAATALVEIGKKHLQAVAATALRWSASADPDFAARRARTCGAW